MRTVRVGSSRPPHSTAFDSSSRNACATDSRTSSGSFGVELHHEVLNPFGDFERARRHQLEPLRPRRRPPRSAAPPPARRRSTSLTTSTIRAGANGFAHEPVRPGRGTTRSSVSGRVVGRHHHHARRRRQRSRLAPARRGRSCPAARCRAASGRPAAGAACPAPPVRRRPGPSRYPASWSSAVMAWRKRPVVVDDQNAAAAAVVGRHG